MQDLILLAMFSAVTSRSISVTVSVPLATFAWADFLMLLRRVIISSSFFISSVSFLISLLF